MFSSILKEVTGYFDRRALISAFFPGTIFWGLAVALVLLQQKGWAKALQDWKETEVTGQALLLIAFFVWVAFWAFLTLNFHSSLLRIYEGYWPLKFLSQLRRGHWQQRWDNLDALDKSLDSMESLLEGERADFKTLLESLATLTTEAPPPNIKAIAGKLEIDLSRLKEGADKLERRARGEQTIGDAVRLALLTSGESPVRGPFKWEQVARMPTEDFVKELARLGADAREHWRVYAKYRHLARPAMGTRCQWTRCRAKLDAVTGCLVRMVEGLWGEVEEDRLRLNHEFFLVYSPHRDDVMPTQMGNVLKAAEARVWLRYNLDALLFWSRLLPLLPKEIAEQIQDAKTSLDLMLTLSSGVLLFGLPVSVWMTLQTPTWFLWWVPLILLVFAGTARLFVAAVPAAIALAISLSLPTTRYPAWQASLADANVILTCFAGLTFLSWVCYQNALQACLVYGEKIQSAFDLYRWKVLDELHLQLPPNFEEEREIWKTLGGLLYRGYKPSPAYYSYTRDEKKTKAPIPAATVTTRLPVPARSLPAYRSITEDDIIEVDLPDEQVPVDAASSREKLVSMKPLTTLPALEPVPLSLLKTRQQLEGHVAVGIEVTPADILGGRLRPGDLLDIFITVPSSAPAKYENVLVLDVPPAGTDDASLQNVVVVALPRAQHEDFMAKKASGKLAMALKI